MWWRRRRRAAAVKLPKKLANYRPATVDGESCATCVHMLPNGYCTVVAGLVHPRDVCDYWRPRS